LSHNLVGLFENGSWQRRSDYFSGVSSTPAYESSILPPQNQRVPANSPSTRKGHAGIRKPLTRQRLRSGLSGRSGHPWPAPLGFTAEECKIRNGGRAMETSETVRPSLSISHLNANKPQK